MESKVVTATALPINKMTRKNKSLKSSLLWSVEDPDSGFLSFIFGTMHTKDVRVHQFKKALLPYLQQCGTILTEFALADETEGHDFMNIATEDWWVTLRPTHQKRLTKLFAKLNLGTPQDYRFQPPIMLIQLIAAQEFEEDDTATLDMALAELAQQYGLTWKGVETMSEQLDILKALPIQEQKKQLVDMASNRKKFRKDVKKQLNWYLNQDITHLYKSVRKGLKQLRRPLLIDRNAIMAERLVPLCKSGAQFIAVGAGHLPGGKGLLRLMKTAGFKVKPVQLTVEFN